MRNLLSRLIVLILMLSAMGLGGWLGAKMGVKLVEEYSPPTKPRNLVQPVDEAKYEREGLTRTLNTFRKLESLRWSLPTLITPEDLSKVSELTPEYEVAMRREGPLFKMKPPKKVKEEQKEDKPEREKPKRRDEVKKPASKTEEKKKEGRGKPQPKREEQRRETRKRVFIQVGIYSMRDNAMYILDELKGIGINNVQVVEERKRGLRLFRVLIGPFRDRGEAERMAKYLNSNGYSSYIIEM